MKAGRLRRGKNWAAARQALGRCTTAAYPTVTHRRQDAAQQKARRGTQKARRGTQKARRGTQKARRGTQKARRGTEPQGALRCESVGLSHDLMEMHEGLSLPGVDEIELAVHATALMAAAQRNAEAVLAQPDGVAGDGFYASDIHRTVGIAAGNAPVGIVQHQIAPTKTVTHELVHHHTIALMVLVTEPCRKCADGKGKGMHGHHESSGYTQRNDKFQRLLQQDLYI